MADTLTQNQIKFVFGAAAKGVANQTKGQATSGNGEIVFDAYRHSIWARGVEFGLDTHLANTFTAKVNDSNVAVFDQQTNKDFNLKDGTNISLSVSGTNITINHTTATGTAVPTVTTAKSLSNQTFTAVQSLSKDAQGHITDISIGKFTIPTIPTVYDSALKFKAGSNTSSIFTANANAETTVEFAANTGLAVSLDTTNKKITIGAAANYAIPTQDSLDNFQSVYSWYSTASDTDKDGVIENWHEICDFLKDVSDDTSLGALLSAKANDSAVVHKTGDVSISGTKTFTEDIVGTGMKLSSGGASTTMWTTDGGTITKADLLNGYATTANLKTLTIKDATNNAVTYDTKADKTLTVSGGGGTTVTAGTNTLTISTDLSSYSTIANTVNTVAYDTTNKKITYTKGTTTSDLVTAATLFTDGKATATTDVTGVIKVAKVTNNYTVAANTTSTINANITSGKYYGVELDSTGKAFVYVPWSNTTYTADDGIKIDSDVIKHTNSVTAKTTYGGTDTAVEVNSGSITVTDVKYDAQGHITASTDRSIAVNMCWYDLQ